MTARPVEKLKKNTDGQTDRQTDRQTDNYNRQTIITARQVDLNYKADRQTNRQTDKQTNR